MHAIACDFSQGMLAAGGHRAVPKVVGDAMHLPFADETFDAVTISFGLRNIAEHACVPDDSDPLRHARTTKANLIERAFIAPYWVNYHVEHHMFMHLPCWALPKAHRLLQRKGATARMEVQPGYLSVLGRATSKPEMVAA